MKQAIFKLLQPPVPKQGYAQSYWNEASFYSHLNIIYSYKKGLLLALFWKWEFLEMTYLIYYQFLFAPVSFKI